MDSNQLKALQKRLLRWETHEDSLAPLTDIQRDIVYDLAEDFKKLPLPSTLPDGDISVEQNHDPLKDDIYYFNEDNSQAFLKWYETLEEEIVRCDDAPYLSYHKQLEERRNECNELLQQVDASLTDLKKLSFDYNVVSTKTNALHSVSEQLLADQIKLHDIREDIKQKLHYFTQVEHISQRLNSPTTSISSDAFFEVLSKIDECIDYIEEHPNYKESHSFLVKYKHSLSRAIGLMKSYVSHVLNHATEQILAPRLDSGGTDMKNMDTAFAVYFGKFQAAAPKLTRILQEVETRADKYEEYATLLSDLQQEYAGRRLQVAGGAVSSALKSLAAGGNPGSSGGGGSDHCALVRSACSLLAHASRDEFHLYSQFFQKPSSALDEYLVLLCNMLYETLRPYIIHVNHLETLAELCAILRVEVIEEHVNNDPETLYALGKAAQALLQDAQERLVFRAHVHLRSDVLHYRPAPGDLAYPDKLEMMEQIALSIQEQSLRRSDSHNSLASAGSNTSQEVAAIIGESQRKVSTSSTSPADLHGMWYPGVRRTLAALSRLYRCLERRVFQGLAQEALSLCVTSVDSAAKQISANKTNIDGELFQIKHLLILREQIAPFQVDFVVKETSLDFSNVKTAAYGLIQNRGHIFSLNSNNALLEFLIEGTPMVKEHLLDSRKEVDRQLKSSCEAFIGNATDILAKPLRDYLEKGNKVETNENIKPSANSNDVEEIAAALRETSRRIKAHLAPLQRSMQLYLANKETEFILFRPIRNNVIGYFIQIEQVLHNGKYTPDDIIVASCPTAEQVTVLISSASLLAGSEFVLPYGKQKRKTSVAQKPSVSTENEKRKESVDVSQGDNKAFVV